MPGTAVSTRCLHRWRLGGPEGIDWLVMSADAPQTPYWVLISVLFSTFPLEEGLALALHRIALDLYRRSEDEGHIDHNLAHGVLRNLRNEAVIGATSGPIFEADLETERGQGQVRFLLTRQGLELMGLGAEARDARPKYLN